MSTEPPWKRSGSKLCKPLPTTADKPAGNQDPRYIPQVAQTVASNLQEQHVVTQTRQPSYSTYTPSHPSVGTLGPQPRQSSSVPKQPSQSYNSATAAKNINPTWSDDDYRRHRQNEQNRQEGNQRDENNPGRPSSAGPGDDGDEEIDG